MSHLKQAIFKVSKAGQDLAMQTTGDDQSNLNKAILLGNLIYEVQEMLGHALDTIEADDDFFKELKGDLENIDDYGELSGLVEKLEEATAEPEEPDREHIRTHAMLGTVPFVNRS